MQNIKLVWSRHRIPLVQVWRCLSQSLTYSKYFFYVHMYIHRDEILVHKHVFQKLLNHMHSSSAKRFRVVTFSTFSWTCIHLFNNNCTVKKTTYFIYPESWELGSCIILCSYQIFLEVDVMIKGFFIVFNRT